MAGVMAHTPALSTEGPVYAPLHRPSLHHAGSMSRTAFTIAGWKRVGCEHRVLKNDANAISHESSQAAEDLATCNLRASGRDTAGSSAFISRQNSMSGK